MKVSRKGAGFCTSRLGSDNPDISRKIMSAIQKSFKKSAEGCTVAQCHEKLHTSIHAVF